MSENNGEPSLSSIHSELIRMNGNLEKHVDLTEERLDRHKDRMDTIEKTHSAQVEKFEHKWARYSKEVYGEGESDPGLKSNMTRVLLIQNASIWVLSVFGIAVIGLVANALWNLLTKH